MNYGMKVTPDEARAMRRLIGKNPGRLADVALDLEWIVAEDERFENEITRSMSGPPSKPDLG